MANLTNLDSISSDIISFKVPLPAKVTQQVGIDVEFLERMCKIGGIGHLTIDATEQSPTQIRTESSKEADSSGIIKVIASKIDHAVTTNLDTYNLGEKLNASNKCGIWPDVHVTLDIQRILDQISEEGMDSTDPMNWVKPLNEGVRTCMLKGAKKILLTGDDQSTFIDTILISAIVYGTNYVVPTIGLPSSLFIGYTIYRFGRWYPQAIMHKLQEKPPVRLGPTFGESEFGQALYYCTRSWRNSDRFVQLITN